MRRSFLAAVAMLALAGCEIGGPAPVPITVEAIPDGRHGNLPEGEWRTTSLPEDDGPELVHKQGFVDAPRVRQRVTGGDLAVGESLLAYSDVQDRNIDMTGGAAVSSGPGTFTPVLADRRDRGFAFADEPDDVLLEFTYELPERPCTEFRVLWVWDVTAVDDDVVDFALSWAQLYAQACTEP